MQGNPETSDEVAITRAPGRIVLKMLSNPATLRPVRLAGEEFCRQSGMTPTQVEEIGLCVNEAVANVMRHQYHGDEKKPIEVTFSVTDGHMNVDIRDWGTPFDPNRLPKGARTCCDVDEIKPGGLGLMCMRKLMDRVEFIPQSNGMLLTMSKKFGSLPK